MQTATDVESETSKETTECNGTDVETSSGTLELPSEFSSLEFSKTTSADETMNSDQNDSSYSTMSSDAGSPNLSLSK